MTPMEGDARPLVQNAADVGQVRAARKREGYNARRQLDDVRELLLLPSFRRFAWRLLSQARVYDARRQGNEDQQFDAGRRNLGLFVLAEIIKANPDAYLEMMRDAQKEKSNV